MSVVGAALLAIFALVAGTCLAKLFRCIFCARKKVPSLESARDTISKVEIDDFCSFCNKEIGSEERWPLQMHRHIKTEIILGGNRFTFENITVNVPCCDECRAANMKEKKQANGISLVGALSLAVLSAIGVFIAKPFPKDVFSTILLCIFVAMCAGYISFEIIRVIVRPRFEVKLLNTPLAKALLGKGWRLGHSGGQPVD